MNKSVGIVIVNYNGAAYQNDCIKSLYDMDFQNFEIIVVDSNSSDNSIELLKRQYPNVHVLKQDTNVGVAAGNNIGIHYSIEIGMAYTLLMNNDVVVDKNMLRELVGESIENVVTVPKIYYYKPSDSLWYCGGVLDWLVGGSRHLRRGSKDSSSSRIKCFVEYAPTCCMLINNILFQKVGLFDEKYFMYFDDTDFCVRLQEKGIRILYVPNSFLWHKVSSSTGGEFSKLNIYYYTRNHMYFINKYQNKISFFTKILTVTKDIAKICLKSWTNANYLYIYKAYLDYYSGRMGRADI